MTHTFVYFGMYSLCTLILWTIVIYNFKDKEEDAMLYAGLVFTAIISLYWQLVLPTLLLYFVASTIADQIHKYKDL